MEHTSHNDKKNSEIKKRISHLENNMQNSVIESPQQSVSTETIFTNNFDFLIFKMLNILTANDKPVFFIIPPLILVVANFYFDYINPVHLSCTVFILYQYVCGNSFYTFFKNALFYFIVVGAVSFFYFKK